MKQLERNWPTCEAVTVRIHWTCVCGHTLKGWDVILSEAIGRADVPLRVLCSHCHTELMTVERASDRDA
jgi:hypothetical protein